MKIIQNIAFVVVLIILFNDITIAQPKFRKKNTQDYIQFKPRIETGTTLIYELKRYRVSPLTKSTRKIDSNRFQMELKIISISNSALNFTAQLDEIQDTMMNAIINGLKAQILFDYKNQDFEIKNEKELTDIIKKRITKIKENQPLDAISVQTLNMLTKLAESSGFLKKTFNEVREVIRHYHILYPFNKFVMDSNQLENMFDDGTFNFRKEAVFELRQNYLYQSRNNIVSKAKMDTLISNNPSMDREKNLPYLSMLADCSFAPGATYNFMDIRFHKETGVLQSFIYEEQASWSDQYNQSKKVYTLIKQF